MVDLRGLGICWVLLNGMFDGLCCEVPWTQLFDEPLVPSLLLHCKRRRCVRTGVFFRIVQAAGTQSCFLQKLTDFARLKFFNCKLNSLLDRGKAHPFISFHLFHYFFSLHILHTLLYENKKLLTLSTIV